MLSIRRSAISSSVKFAMPLRARINQAMLPALRVSFPRKYWSHLTCQSYSTSAEEDDVLFIPNRAIRTIQLNRPSKLNSLNQSMCNKIMPCMVEWTKSDVARTIILKGAGNKALCAGGDVAALAKGIAERGKEGSDAATSFFKDEYQLNQLIATYPKPYVALMNGITMGGGVGLSVHAPFRVATEKTLLAMPETDIGFFPDVGATFFLSRLDGEIGTYLALTSDRLKGYDAVAAGFATHYIPESQLPALEARLAEIISDDKVVPTDPFNLVNNVLEEFGCDAPENYVFHITGERRELIDRAFSKDTVEDIVAELQKDGSEWALKTRDTILARSPISVKTTLQALRSGRDIGITEAFSREYRLAEQFMHHPDFVEGVSAKLMSKPPRTPQWNPASIGDVSSSAVGEMLKPLADSTMSDIEFVNPNETFSQYPHKFGLPSEIDIQNYITGNDGSDREFKVSREEVFDHFQLLTRSKLGVNRKLTEVLARKTKSDPTDDTLLDWIY